MLKIYRQSALFFFAPSDKSDKEDDITRFFNNIYDGTLYIYNIYRQTP